MDKITAKEIDPGPEEEFGFLDGTLEEQLAELDRLIASEPSLNDPEEYDSD